MLNVTDTQKHVFRSLKKIMLSNDVKNDKTTTTSKYSRGMYIYLRKLILIIIYAQCIEG